MGVPKFFRYISERYPCLSELARERCIPEFDNLYLDMNGIIHNCTHPDDTNMHLHLTEEEMFQAILKYIDKLFFLIKPGKVFFMAVDGVAPRAKMNQQRSRRFRSAKDAEAMEKSAELQGFKREHERFDSNCITPGTEFMVRLHECLKDFVRKKIAADELWQKCRIILSGHDSPGEGEHKIMNYIRYMKAQKDYDPNTRHCLYGLDADLIILGLCTHELHFVVLREEVKFGRQNKRTSVEQTRFFLLHLGLFREYLMLEFEQLRQYPSFDIAKLIDDWVLMGFLVGNDFIPHLPCLHISSNALPLLYKTYIRMYPELGGNINEYGKLNLERLEKFFAAMSEVEYELFEEGHADLKYFEAKKGANGIDEAFDFDVGEIIKDNVDKDLATLIENSNKFLEDDDVNSSDEAEHIAAEFENYKRDYYENKLEKKMSSEVKHEQAIGYITALQWILDYYYRGVQSWEWYYPHHYAPFISDLKGFKDHKINFKKGKPFLPFEQLLAVLPAASRQLLPNAYQNLMTSADSEVIQFYPDDFKTDLNGKAQEWEAVVLIPFIDEKLLLRAMKACEHNLRQEEVRRNRHGPMLLYEYSRETTKESQNLHCSETAFWAKDIEIPVETTVCVEHPDAARTVFFPGFPTMKHLKFDFEFRCARVRVFDYASRNENMILKPHVQPGLDDICTVAEKYLNQIVYIGWPHLVKAKVVAISNEKKYVDIDGIKEMDPKAFNLHVHAAKDHLSGRMGIEFPDFSVLVHVVTYVGSSWSHGSMGKLTLKDTWSPVTTQYPAHGVVGQICVYNALSNEKKRVEDLYPIGSLVYFLGSPYFGAQGTIVDPQQVYKCGRLKVHVLASPVPDFSEAKYVQSRLTREYINSYQAACAIGIHIKCLVRLTGSVLIVAGEKREKVHDSAARANIGLQFKFPKAQEERVGYAHRINNQWYFSPKAISVVQEYCYKYPMIISFLSTTDSSERSDIIFESDMRDECSSCVDEIAAWIKTLEHMQAERMPCGSQVLEKETILKVIEAVEQLQVLPNTAVKLSVKPHMLLKPNVSLPESYKSKQPVTLFDRVVVVRTTYMVPVGCRGTVVGIHPVTDPNPVRLECLKAVENFLEVLFDETVPNIDDIHGVAPNRVSKVPESAILLIDPKNARDKKHSNQFVNESPNVSMPNFLPPKKMLNNQMSFDRPTNAIAPPPTAATNSRDFWMPTANTKAKHYDKVSNETPNIDNNLHARPNVPHSVISTPPITGSKSHDFWNSTANTRVKKYEKVAPESINIDRTTQARPNGSSSAHVSSKPNKSQPSPKINPPSPPLNVATQKLKEALGISPRGAAGPQSGKPSDRQKPPPPPACWRSDAQDMRNSQPPLMNFQRLGPLVSPIFPPMAMMQQHAPSMSNAMSIPNAMQMCTMQTYAQVMQQQMAQQQPPRPQLHMGQGNIFMPDSMQQKSAFIPLQAMRRDAQHQQQPKRQQNTQAANVNSLNAPLQNMCLNGTTPMATNKGPAQQATQSFQVKNQDVPRPPDAAQPSADGQATKRTPRVPRIGAKFDFPPQ